MITYANEIRLTNGQIYSVDMIRLSLQFKDTVQDFVNWMNLKSTYGDNLEVDHWLSVREFAYRNLFQIKTNEYSFALAIGFNGKSEDRNKGYMEFNPNKCKGEQFQLFWSKLIDYIISSEVTRFDLAIDIPMPRYLLRLEKDNRNYQFISSQKSETEYLGQRSHPGFVKLYDKTKESKIDYDLTRLEVTADLRTNINFPSVKVLPSQERFEFDKLNSTDKVLIQLLKQADNPIMYLKQLKYEKRKKIEPYLCEDTVQLDKQAYREIIKRVSEYQF